MTESTTNAGHVWFITGTSTGFGRALAEEALERGDRVVATARDPEQVRYLEQDYPELARAVRLDVTDLDEVRDSAEPPLRLPLGQDSLDQIREKLDDIRQETDLWERTTVETSFP